MFLLLRLSSFWWCVAFFFFFSFFSLLCAAFLFAIPFNEMSLLFVFSFSRLRLRSELHFLSIFIVALGCARVLVHGVCTINYMTRYGFNAFTYSTMFHRRSDTWNEHVLHNSTTRQNRFAFCTSRIHCWRGIAVRSKKILTKCFKLILLVLLRDRELPTSTDAAGMPSDFILSLLCTYFYCGWWVHFVFAMCWWVVRSRFLFIPFHAVDIRQKIDILYGRRRFQRQQWSLSMNQGNGDDEKIYQIENASHF